VPDCSSKMAWCFFPKSLSTASIESELASSLVRKENADLLSVDYFRLQRNSRRAKCRKSQPTRALPSSVGLSVF